MSEVYNQIVPQFREKMENMKRNLQKALEKEKLKVFEYYHCQHSANIYVIQTEAYKKKAVQAHEKNKVLIARFGQSTVDMT